MCLSLSQEIFIRFWYNKVSIHDYLVHIKYLGGGYKMVFSFETVSLATLYVSVLFALVYIVVLKKRIEE